MSLIKNIKLLVVPARIIEVLVDENIALTELENFDTMTDILTPEDLLFYTSVNQDLFGTIPKEILEAFGYTKEEPKTTIWEPEVKPKEPVLSLPETFSSKCRIYMSTAEMFKTGEYLYHIANCNHVNADVHSNAPNVNNYVAQYFEISPTTIGVTLTLAEVPTTANREAVEGLMALLYDDYLSNAEIVNSSDRARTPLTRAERNTFCLRELSQSGLVKYFSENLMNN